ncbi:MAG TPA: adenylate/guanylate cyclase domain-containing protein [Solirubrobacteraceae bacterium]|nr:adenylate/guanylate cyclase domain-containing protein [Solirubrobacteraceae bacterium]
MLVIVGMLAVGIGIVARATHVTRGLEQSSIDARFQIRGRTPPPPGMALVAIDAATFNYLRDAQLPSRFPFPRRYYARVLDNLHRAGAHVIAVDIQFTEPTDAADDNALYDAVGRDRPVVLSTTEVKGDGQTAILGGNANLRAAGASPGDTLFFPDSDGIIRRFAYAIQGLKTFGAAIAQAAGRPVRASAFHGPVPIDFAYPAGTIPTVSFSSAWRGTFDPALVRGKIVFIGATAPSLQDIHAVATTGTMSGPELQANATSTALRGLPLSDGSAALAIILIVVLGAAQPLVSIGRPRLRWVSVALVLGIVYVVAVQLAFNGGVIFDLVDPLLGLTVATMGSLAVLYLAETIERERVRGLFARFVPVSVVEQVLARTDENLRLGAVERECTVLFSDLRGFTAFSEGQHPQKVLDVVNFYLAQMTEAILAAGGTLIAYMGDGIMALFGAPLEQDDHADRALAAAREMLGPRLERFNEWMLEQGYASGFRMGIGLHSGLVMAGNVGSDERLDYTAIGDTTNTASRLEGMTKGKPYMLFVSAATRERLTRPPDDLVFVDELEVRGRAEKIAVWSIDAAAVPDESAAADAVIRSVPK